MQTHFIHAVCWRPAWRHFNCIQTRFICSNFKKLVITHNLWVLWKAIWNKATVWVVSFLWRIIVAISARFYPSCIWSQSFMFCTFLCSLPEYKVCVCGYLSRSINIVKEQGCMPTKQGSFLRKGDSLFLPAETKLLVWQIPVKVDLLSCLSFSKHTEGKRY